MEDAEKRKLIIGAALVAGVLLIGVLVWQLTRPKTPVVAEKPVHVWDKPRALTLTHQLNQQAWLSGIDTLKLDTTVTESEATTKLTHLLLELRYGQKPTGWRYSGLPEQTDTAWAVSVAGQGRPDSVVTALKTATAFGPYQALATHYQRLRTAGKTDSLRVVWRTLNFYRYLNRFSFEKFAVINIPAAELNVYDRTGKRLLPMEVIVGKKDKKTPRFSAYINDLTMYPYWNVPPGIGVNEILPKVQRNVSYLNNQNMEVLDSHDRPVDPNNVDWASVDTDNFPYRFRQASGCDNSLGLLKFNLSVPFDIYLHDTNARDLFYNTTDRWRSHGCVRVQKPVELANFVLGEPRFTKAFMNTCLTEAEPQTIKLPHKFPVFVVYNLADIDAARQLRFYPNVYGL